jgi:hypothetical protein
MTSPDSIVSILYRYYQEEQLSDKDILFLEEWLEASSDNQLLFDELSNKSAWEANLAAFKSEDAHGDATRELIRQRIQNTGG